MTIKLGVVRLGKLVEQVVNEIPLAGETVSDQNLIYQGVLRQETYDGTPYYTFHLHRGGMSYVGGYTCNGNTEVVVDASVNRGSQYNIRVKGEDCHKLSVAFARASRLLELVEALKK